MHWCGIWHSRVYNHIMCSGWQQQLGQMGDKERGLSGNFRQFYAKHGWLRRCIRFSQLRLFNDKPHWLEDLSQCLCLWESLGVIGGVPPSAKSSFHKPVCPSSRASQVLQQTCGSPQRGDFGKWDGDLSRAKSQTQGTASGSVCKMQQTSSYSILQRVTMISWIMC